MSLRRISALITPNIFQNGLSRHQESWRIYTHLLHWLTSDAINGWVTWYISELDYDLAFTLREIYQLGGDRSYEAACRTLQHRVKVCRLDPHILEDSGCYRLNFYDAMRLACAVDRNVDAIVSWEPELFATKEQENDDFQRNGYFDIRLRSEMADDQTATAQRIRVFSLSTFFLYLEQLRQPQFWEERSLSQFRLERLKIDTSEDGSEIQATVTICDPSNQPVRATAISSTPCGAICEAIDQCIDHLVALPPRQLIGITMPNMRIEGAKAAIEVLINVECDRRIFRASADHGNTFHAFGNAYIDTINQICHTLNRR